MTHETKFVQGTPDWFHMIGKILTDAAANAGLPPKTNVSFVERYSDGKELSDGLIQGIRLDIINGAPSYRIGAAPGEKGDINVMVTADAARQLNTYYSDDPKLLELLTRYQATGEWQVDGDLCRLGDWLASTHDPIVARTK